MGQKSPEDTLDTHWQSKWASLALITGGVGGLYFVVARTLGVLELQQGGIDVLENALRLVILIIGLFLLSIALLISGAVLARRAFRKLT